jgi:hypothetical protein
MHGCSICHVGPCGLQIKLVKRPCAKIARTMLPLKSDTTGPVHSDDGLQSFRTGKIFHQSYEFIL